MKKVSINKASINKVLIKRLLELISVRGLGVVLQLLMQFAIARLGGASAVGLMQIYQTWTCVLGETAAMGLPTQTMKSVSMDQHGINTLFRLRNSLKIILIAWVVVSAVLIVSNWLFPGAILLSMGNQLALVWSVLCFAVLRVAAEALKAMGHQGVAIFSENSIVPVMLLILSSLMLIAGFQSDTLIMGFLPVGETLVYAASLFLTLAMAYSLHTCFHVIRKKCPHVVQKKHFHGCQKNIFKVGNEESETCHRAVDDKAGKKPLLTSETRFFWGTAILSIGFLNLPFLLMPFYGTTEQVGLFALAFKCLNPISTILIMLGAIFGPLFAKALLEHNRTKSQSTGLGSLLLQSQLISIGLYLPVLLPILFFADPLLALFGEEFREAKIYLFILAMAQLINALTGLSGNMLNMVGLGKVEFQGALVFSLAAVLSGIWAGSVYGLEGIAISYSVSLAGKNLWSYAFALAFLRSKSAFGQDDQPDIKRTKLKVQTV